MFKKYTAEVLVLGVASVILALFLEANLPRYILSYILSFSLVWSLTYLCPSLNRLVVGLLAGIIGAELGHYFYCLQVANDLSLLTSFRVGQGLTEASLLERANIIYGERGLLCILAWPMFGILGILLCSIRNKTYLKKSV